MQDARIEATEEPTGVDVTETVQEAADAVVSMDPNRIMEFLQNNGLDAGTFVALGKNIIVALLIYYIGRFIIRMVVGGLRKVLQRQNVDKTLETFVCNLVRIVLLVMVIIAAIGALGIQTTSFIAIFGAAGLAVGLALQGSLSNFAAGVMLIIFRPFKVGDFIDAAGVSGSVEEILIFSTKLKSPDNKQLYVPNGSILSGTIVNYSAKDQRRVDLKFGCGYDDDIKKAKALLEEIITSNPLVLSDPAPTIGVLELGDSSVNFAVRPWVNTADYWNAYFQITEDVKQRFDEAGISIPFPQRDVHLIKNEAA